MKSHTTLRQLGFVTLLTLGLLAVATGRLPRMFATEAAAMLAPQATITVNSTADGAPANNGACTLREALMNANGANQSGSTDCAAGGTTTNTITFSLPAGPQTITLTGALPDITRSLTITGPGANLLNVTRPPGVYNNSATWYRIFTIPIGGLNIAISGLTVSNGYLNGIGGSGGGIQSSSNLTLTNCAIANNTSLGGGGVHVGGGDAVFTGCTFSGNYSANSGGGINFGGNTLRLTNCTISNNFGSSGGGGIRMIGNTLEVTNCTIANNTQYLNGSGAGSGILTVTGITHLRNTIIANNNLPNLKVTNSGSIVSLGNNLTSDDGGGFLNQPGDKINTNPLLASLGNYGGPTQTLSLLPSSPALNAGNNCVLTNNCVSNNLGFNLITDQRGAGFNRQIGTVDMGAFESRFTIAVFTGASTAAANERTTNSTYTFPDTLAGNSTAQTFTIKNTGTANLTGIVVTITGANPTDFVLGALGATTLAPNATTTFTVSFKPLYYGVRNAVINIASNEVDPNPFVINVSGTGLNSPPTITASNLTRQKGSPAANGQIATVMDAQDPEQTLAVTVNGGASATVNGVTISNLTVNTTGQVRADVAATCTATNASFTLTVRDYVGATANATLNVTVTANAAPVLTYPNQTVAAGGALSINPTTGLSDNGTVSSVVVQSKGTYTGTISVNASGVVSISNAKPGGVHTITIRATDNCGAARDASFILTVNCPTISLSPGTLPSGTAGTSYNQSLTASGGAAPYGFSLSAGTLPGGLSLSAAGVLSGTPTAFGTFNITVKATDANGCQGTKAYSLVINQPTCPTITVNPASLASGIIGTAYSQTFTQTGGAGAITWSSIGTLPAGLALNGSTGVLSGTPTTAGSFTFTIQAQDANNCSGSRQYTVLVSGASAGLAFYPLPSPLRLLDTRAGFSGCDAPGAPIAGGTSRTQLARRTCNGVTIPAGAMAVTGNVTTVQSGGGYLTLYPSGVAQPLAASSNFNPNEVLNNVFTVGLGDADGSFKIFATSNTDVVVDITGYYAPAAAAGLYFHPLPKPVRLLETRTGQTGCYAPGVALAADTDTTQSATGGCAGVTIPATAQAIVGNATTVGPQTGGYLTFYPANAQRPLAASSNFATGQVINAPFTVGLSPAGMFNIYTTSQTDLVIDVLGYYSADASDANGTGLLFNPLPSPVRLLETRAGQTGCTTPNAPLAAGSIRDQQARGVCGGQAIADTAAAIVGNATVINAQAGYLTFWPNGAAQPLVATTNFAAGQILNRHFTAGLGANGMFSVFASAQTDLIIDVSGFFAP